MFGRRISFNKFHNLNFSTGISYVQFGRRNNINNDEINYSYELTRTRTIGLPLEFKYWNNALWRYMAGSISASVNLNNKQSLYMISLGVMLGNTREKRDMNQLKDRY